VNYIIDTYAWIEYFTGSKQGELVKKLLGHKEHKAITMECCVAELKGYCLREDWDFQRVFRVVNAQSIILPVLREHWLRAAEIRSEYRIPNFSLVDALLVAKQEELKCRIASGDSHFKSLRNVLFLRA
jgi:predicted nucleic acid-binding protein